MLLFFKVKCSFCQCNLSDNSNFCGHCGGSFLTAEVGKLPLGVGCKQYQVPEEFAQVIGFTQLASHCISVARGQTASFKVIIQTQLSLYLALLWLFLLGIFHAVFRLSASGLIFFPFIYLFAALVSVLVFHGLVCLAGSSRRVLWQSAVLLVFQHAYVALLLVPFQWVQFLLLFTVTFWGNFLLYLQLSRFHQLENRKSFLVMSLMNIIHVAFATAIYYFPERWVFIVKEWFRF